MNTNGRRRFQEYLWDLTGEVTAAPTRRDVDKRVCEGLQSTSWFDGAWICDHPPEPTPRTAAGKSPGEIDRIHTVAGAADDGAPWDRAANDHEGVVETLSGEDIGEDLAVGWVALHHRQINYGVLGVATEHRRPGELCDDVETLANFGAVVGHALATNELQAQGETFRQAVEQAGPAIAILDGAGTIEYTNSSFDSVLGYSNGGAVGARFDDLLANVPADAVTEAETGAPWRDEVVCQRNRGREIHVDVSVAPVPIEDIRQKYVAIASDITPLRQHQQRIQVLNRVLRHNLRNDLNVARGRIEHVVDDVESPRARSSLETAADTIDTLVAIAEKARRVEESVGRAGSDETGVVDVVPVLDELVDQFRQQYPGATIDLTAPGECTVHGENVEAALWELLTNAVEHNDTARPSVTVRVGPDDGPDGFAEVRIEDDGPGIPRSEREVLEKGIETELSHGSSLGLWLVKWTVAASGGRLDIDATDGEGTCVKVHLQRPRAD